MGVRLPVEMDPPRTGGSGLAGRGCVTVEAEEEELRGNVKRDGGESEEQRPTASPRYRTTASRGLRFTGFTGDGFLGLSGNRRAPSGTNRENNLGKITREISIIDVQVVTFCLDGGCVDREVGVPGQVPRPDDVLAEAACHPRKARGL